MSLKEYAQRKWDEMKKERAERIGYNKILREKAKLADRQAYAKEYEHQVRLKAKQDAKAKFAPRPASTGFGPSAITSAAASMGTTNIFSQATGAVPKKVKGYKQPPAWDVTAGIFNQKKRRR